MEKKLMYLIFFSLSQFPYHFFVVAVFIYFFFDFL